jgi:putative FmdB family regulatory protein
MPLYSCVCKSCGEPSEILVSRLEYLEEEQCPKCAKLTLVRQLSAPAKVSASKELPTQTCGTIGPSCGAPW